MTEDQTMIRDAAHAAADHAWVVEGRDFLTGDDLFGIPDSDARLFGSSFRARIRALREAGEPFDLGVAGHDYTPGSRYTPRLRGQISAEAVACAQGWIDALPSGERIPRAWTQHPNLSDEDVEALERLLADEAPQLLDEGRASDEARAIFHRAFTDHLSHEYYRR